MWTCRSLGNLTPPTTEVLYTSLNSPRNNENKFQCQLLQKERSHFRLITRKVPRDVANLLAIIRQQLKVRGSGRSATTFFSWTHTHHRPIPTIGHLEDRTGRDAATPPPETLLNTAHRPALAGHHLQSGQWPAAQKRRGGKVRGGGVGVQHHMAVVVQHQNAHRPPATAQLFGGQLLLHHVEDRLSGAIFQRVPSATAAFRPLPASKNGLVAAGHLLPALDGDHLVGDGEKLQAGGNSVLAQRFRQWWQCTASVAAARFLTRLSFWSSFGVKVKVSQKNVLRKSWSSSSPVTPLTRENFSSFLIGSWFPKLNQQFYNFKVLKKSRFCVSVVAQVFSKICRTFCSPFLALSQKMHKTVYKNSHFSDRLHGQFGLKMISKL